MVITLDNSMLLRVEALLMQHLLQEIPSNPVLCLLKVDIQSEHFLCEAHKNHADQEFGATEATKQAKAALRGPDWIIRFACIRTN